MTNEIINSPAGSGESAADPNIEVARIGMKQAVIVALITAFAGIITGILTGYFALPKPIDPQIKQGVKDLSLEGKWKYICTDYKLKYQHGGRFYIEKDDHGGLILIGQRMFKDVYNDSASKWSSKTFPSSGYANWNSTWIYVRDNVQFNFEYEITSLNKKGYCTGHINKVRDIVQSITGNFYQLFPAENLAGSVIFTKITDEEYANPVWDRIALMERN
jgi:hypothetical protein